MLGLGEILHPRDDHAIGPPVQGLFDPRSPDAGNADDTKHGGLFEDADRRRQIEFVPQSVLPIEHAEVQRTHGRGIAQIRRTEVEQSS